MEMLAEMMNRRMELEGQTETDVKRREKRMSGHRMEAENQTNTRRFLNRARLIRQHGH